MSSEEQSHYSKYFQKIEKSFIMFSLPKDENYVEQNRGKYNNNLLLGIINVNLL
jgi:hypothetical protein